MKYIIRHLEDDIYTGSTEDGRIIFVDGRDINRRKYYSPSELILIAAGGCTLIDVKHILEKMRQNFEKLEVSIDGRRRTDHPRIYEYVEVTYNLWGDIDPNKAIKAVELSVSKYCSALATLKGAGATLKYKVLVNGEEVYSNDI